MKPWGSTRIDIQEESDRAPGGMDVEEKLDLFQWYRRGREVVSMWERSRIELQVGLMWKKSGTDVEEEWYRCGRGVVSIWKRGRSASSPIDVQKRRMESLLMAIYREIRVVLSTTHRLCEASDSPHIRYRLLCPAAPCVPRNVHRHDEGTIHRKGGECTGRKDDAYQVPVALLGSAHLRRSPARWSCYSQKENRIHRPMYIVQHN